MNDTADAADLVAQWRNNENQDNPADRYMPLGSSRKRISLTQLPSLLPGALLAPARLASLLLNRNDVTSLR